MLHAQWWLPEKRRAYGSVTSAAVLTLPVGLAGGATIGSTTYVGYVLLLLATYLAVYVVSTLVVFARVPGDVCRDWARHTRPGTRLERWVLGTQPGAGLATVLSGFSLFAIVLGQSAEFWWAMGLSSLVGAIVIITLLVGAWLTVAITYAVEYMCRDQREPGVQLAFPGGDDVEWMDYLYFSFAVSTTFGTTDVDVRQTTTRRTVTGHGLIAFVFNTVILAVAIGALS